MVGRAGTKLISTMRSVPPTIGAAAGCADFAASASAQNVSWKNSTGARLHGRRSAGVMQYTSFGRSSIAVERTKTTGGSDDVLVDSYKPPRGARGEALRLQTLFDDSGLGLRLLVGRDQLDREIRWAYTTDLHDPRRYLSGGELVLTGLMWRNDAEDSESFVSALAEAGVAGLVAGTARLGSTPDDLVRACRDHRIPLLELPVTVSFNAVSDRVILDVAAEPSVAAARGGRWRGPLVTAVAGAAEVGEIARLVTEEIGGPCLIMSTMDYLVAGSDAAADLTSTERNRLVTTYLRNGPKPTLVGRPGESGTVSVFGPGEEMRERLAGWFVALAGDHRSNESAALVAELLTALALLRARLDEGRHVASRTTGAALRTMVEGTGTPAGIGTQLAELGRDRADSVWAVAADADGDHATTESVLAELATALALPTLIGRLDGEVLAVFGEPDDPTVALSALRRRIETLEPAASKLTVGVSSVVPMAALRGACEEAQHARLLAAHRLGRSASAPRRGGRVGPRTCVVEGSEVASHHLLLAALPETLRWSYPTRLLRDLQDYDAVHQSDLIHTLDVFLATSCSWSRTASELHVHVNTLRYRIKRIEEISGKDLSRFGDRVELFLALELS